MKAERCRVGGRNMLSRFSAYVSVSCLATRQTRVQGMNAISRRLLSILVWFDAALN